MLRISPFIFLLLFCCSCAQLGSLQTARVLEDDTFRLNANIYAVNADSGDNELGVATLPHAEVGIRYGLGLNTDIGLKISSSLNILLDVKYQFVGDLDSRFAVAAAPGFAWQFTSFDEDTRVLRVHLPIYFSFHPNERDSYYATFKNVYQFVSDSDDTWFPGGNVGYIRQINQRFSIAAEASYFNAYLLDIDNNSDGWNNVFLFGLGFIFEL